MKKREINKLVKHLEFFLNQNVNKVFHDSDNEFHVDILLFEPNKIYPFYKLITMGASDYLMPNDYSTLPNRNEYMLFLSPDLNIESEEFKWYLSFLSYVSKYAFYIKKNISVGHTIELEPNSHHIFTNSFIMFPEIIKNTAILRCDLGWFKSCACLQVMPITEIEYQQNLAIGPESFYEIFYPEDGNPIYLANRKIEE